MKLWGRAHDNVSNCDKKARIIGLQFTIVVLSHSGNLSSSLQRAEQYTVDAQKNIKLSVIVLQVYNQIWMHASIGPCLLKLL